MKKIPFIIQYVKSTLGPNAIFDGRKALGFWQMVIVFIFLNALLLLPVSAHFANQTSFDLPEIMPGMATLGTDQFANDIQSLSLENGELTDKNAHLVEKSNAGVAGVNLTDAELRGAENVINLKVNEMQLKDASGYTFEVTYPKDATLAEITSGESLVNWISAQWYLENQAFVFLSMVMMIGSIVFVSSLMLAIFTTLFIWMTKRSSFSKIASFKESLNLTLNALGIPVIAACLIGFIYFDITIIMAVQSLGMVLMIAWTFLKTRFYKTSEKNMAASR
ncbi:DUF1189 domain-containing protein [Listeria ivanovii]|uniref:DUF1189 domain-containing protein n=1 Tax=Listeria ivanovii TaxID=1638 RepID=UPI000DA9230D|nr:DUF1189 domain-containing protein [Listeria ivanovii]PZF90736.1 DUF1189 domain-containing protein [Listeria ivanovii]PZF96144.1 DUF1189 domain-containing protein [Listeria ivanovii]PZG06355.1 DUF1189 domain-containing protein [Listeria ivanovii]PZG11206.1 DUF1189 domain-containing protein [Listeria ivanovii]PZG28296.1 DUF1189 domain-containing protein [Listeria ivanovii]